MKILLKSVLMVFLLTAGFGAAQAQKKGGHDFDPAKKADHQTAMMKEKLSLSESQTAKVKDINLKYAQKGKAAHDANKEGDKAKRHEAHKALRAEQTAELNGVLTAEQAKTWEQLKTERKSKDGKGGKCEGKKDKSKIKKG